MKKILSLILALVMVMSLAACGADQPGQTQPANNDDTNVSEPVEVDPAEFLNGKTIRVVLGSTSVTGDTYLVSDVACRMVNDKYGCNLHIDPIGASRALEEVVTVKDEETIMMFHDSTYLGVLFGAYDEDEYKLENMTVGVTYGFNPGDCFAASASAPYTTIAEMGEWMSQNPDETVRLAVEAGGVSELGFDAIYLWLEETYGADVAANLKVFPSGDTAVKLQALWDGNVQGIYAAATAVQEYTLDGVDAQLKVNIIGLMGDSIEGQDWPTFAEQGIAIAGTPFNFTKEYTAFYGSDVSPEFIAALDAAFEDVCTSQEYLDAVAALGYSGQYMSSADSNAHFYAKRDEMKAVIENCPNLDDLVG